VNNIIDASGVAKSLNIIILLEILSSELSISKAFYFHAWWS